MTISGGGKKVLLMSVSAGSGHVRAAEALEAAFANDPRVGEVRNVDALQFTNKLFRDLTVHQHGKKRADDARRVLQRE
jgi:processive 1,2-diacylglycerol beta-glucosyltransferase